jgi:hypothetical protein
VCTYLYFLYLRVYPFLSHYRVVLHLLYSSALCHQLLHNLNRLAFQFEILLACLEEDPQGFEQVVAENLRRALQRRLQEELGFEGLEGLIRAQRSEERHRRWEGG